MEVRTSGSRWAVGAAAVAAVPEPAFGVLAVGGC